MKLREGDIVWCSQMYLQHAGIVGGYQGKAVVLDDADEVDPDGEPIAVRCLQRAPCPESPRYPYCWGEVISVFPVRMVRLKRGDDGI